MRLYEPHSVTGGTGALADLTAGEPATTSHADHHGDQLVLSVGTTRSALVRQGRRGRPPANILIPLTTRKAN